MPRSPFHDRLRAQKLLWRGLFLSFVGAFRFDPVALLYLALPLAVSPAPRLTGSFSPRLMARLTRFGIYLFLSIVDLIHNGWPLGVLLDLPPCPTAGSYPQALVALWVLRSKG